MAERPITVLVADDEPLARRRLVRLLADVGDVHVAAQCGSGDEVVAALREHGPDAVFLDVRMPGLNGFEALAEIDPGQLPHVVFVTAYDEYAVRAFDVEAVDYVLKPVTAERLAEALRRLRARLEARSPAGESGEVLALLTELAREREGGPSDGGEGGPAGSRGAAGKAGSARHLLLKDGFDATLVPVEDVDWIEADGNHVRVHTRAGAHLARRTLSGLEEILDARRFVRIHRSAIVNLDRVARLTPGFGGSYLVILRDGTELTLSRGFRDDFMGRLGRSL
ncbi:MAG: LytTR family DNA-binding domain-containing protein [Gemmatimonadota bacterium]|jgi:two-component system LytT family response regulator